MAATQRKTARKTVKKTAKKAVKKAPEKKAPAKKAPAKKAKAKTKPKLLSGGNPQIALGYGDAPVQAYIAAAPGWKRDLCRRIDQLITQSVPGVRKAVKWNSPFYGMAEKSWFMSFHIFAKYVKVAFFQGQSLRPVRPANQNTKTSATSTCARMTGSTRNSSSPG